MPNFSYIKAERPSGGSDEEGYFFPDTYKIQSRNWEKDKLRIVVRAAANPCANKEGSHIVKGDTITLTIKESGSFCNGIGYFDFTFLVGPVDKQDYKIFLTRDYSRNP